VFIGHYAVALGAKKAAPPVKLGTLVFAAQFLDLLWPLLLLAGIEHVRVVPDAPPFTRLDLYDYPFSHSLLTSVLWSLLIGGAYYLLHKQKLNSIIVGCTVFSHWVLDLISHTPDLPLAPGSTTFVGLGLWNSTAATIVVEVGLFLAGVILYFRATQPKDTVGKYAPWTLILFLLVSYIASIFSAPPLDPLPITLMGLTMWLFIPWAYWIDRHRQNKIEKRIS
jgi:hypothetical protein